MPAGLDPAAPLVDIAAWLRNGATLLPFCRCAVLARLLARLSYGFSSRCWRAPLDVPGVAGVNISGPASARGYEFGAEVKAELARLIREERSRE